MRKIICFIGFLFVQLDRVIQFCKKQYQWSNIEHGINCYLGNGCTITPNRVKVGNDVYIGKNCCFQSTHGRIEIGDHVMFGPGVHIHGGNHKFDELGRYIKDATPKIQRKMELLR